MALRILMISWEYPPNVVGGLGKHVTDLIPALSSQGVEVHLVTPELRGGAAVEQIAERAWVHRVATPDMSRDGNGFVTFAQTTNQFLAQRAHELIQQGGFDLVHVHDWLVGYAGIDLKHRYHLPLIATIHATERGRGGGNIQGEMQEAINGTERWLTEEAWRIITVSRFMAGQAHDYFGTPWDKISVINNGIHLPSAPKMVGDERQAFRRRFAHDDQPIVFYVGRVVYEKGIQVLIDAAPMILSVQPKTRFVIAGTGGHLSQLQHRAWEREVYGAFVFTGFIPDTDRDHLFQVADVAVFPSLYEPFGIVALEAMAYHCPVVVSATGGLQEVVRLHENGLTAYPDSPESLAWAVTETLARPDWAQSRADTAFAEVQAVYNWERIAAQTTEVYERVVYEAHTSAWGRADTHTA